MSTIEQERVRTEVTTREILHRAADLLEEFGWCQKQLGSKELGQMCVFGALAEAADEFRVPTDILRQAIGQVTPSDEDGRWGHLTTWNDQPGRTRDEVVARLREVAENAA